MTRLFSFFFLLIMTLNVAVPLAEQLQGRDMYELNEFGTDDAEEGKAEKEKETGKEKETLTFSHHTGIHFDAFNANKFKKPLFLRDHLPVSQLFASLPELPPEV